MSDIGDVQIQVNGQWVDMHEWLHTDASPEQVEQIAGRGKGTWVVSRVDIDAIAACGVTVAGAGEAIEDFARLLRSDQ